MLNTLSYIGENLNNANIRWAVGASILLNQYGLIEQPNDIDIFVDERDIEEADELLNSLGEKKKWEMNPTYATKCFYEYEIKGVDVDVMAGFAVNFSGGLFQFQFDENSISEFRSIDGVEIPFTALEDWYVLYQLIPDRQVKVQIIEEYLKKHGVKKPLLLERILKQELPEEVREKIENVLRKCINKFGYI
ncbi:MAG: nucleotidyltransferase [Clostridium sp.]